jgi:hypothetical protein
MSPVAIILLVILGGVLVVAISFVLTLLKEIAVALVRFIAGRVWWDEPTYGHHSTAPTIRISVDAAEFETATPGTRSPIRRASFFPPGYIEPILEPVGSLPDPMIEVSHHDRLLVLARAYVAYRHGTAYRPQTHKESVISISALLDQIFIPIEGGYTYGSDAAIEAGSAAFKLAYQREEEGAARPVKALSPPAQQALASATSDARL